MLRNIRVFTKQFLPNMSATRFDTTISPHPDEG